MKPIKFSIALLFAIVFATGTEAYGQGQDSLIRDNRIEVIKNFRPILSEAIKIPVNPNPEKPEYVKPVFTYDIPELPFEVKPTLYTIKPLSVGTMLLPKLKGNYFKLGYGNYQMPLAEVYLNTVRNKQYQAGIFLKHLSGNGDQAYNNFSNNTAYAYVKKFAAKGVHGLDAYYHRNAVNWYASPNDVSTPPTGSTPPTSPETVYHLYDIKTYSQNFSSDSTGFSYRTDAALYLYNNSGGFKETDGQAKIRIANFKTDFPYELVAGLRLNNNAIKDSSFAYNNYQRFYVDFNPQLYLSGSDISLKAGFNSTLMNDSAGSKFYFFPKAEGAYSIVANKLNVFAGFSGNLNPVTYRRVTSENPFVNGMQLRNTLTKMEIYFGFKGELGPQTSFQIMASSAAIENLITYTQDSANAWQNLSYDDGKAKVTTLSLGFQHQMNEKFRLGFVSNWFGYTLDKLMNPYSLPKFETKVNSSYNIADKFLLKLDLLYWGERTGRIDAYRADGSYVGSEKKMDPFVDVSLGIDYRYSKNLSAFIHVNNIANNRYQKYYGYPVYGLNLLGGFTFTF